MQLNQPRDQEMVPPPFAAPTRLSHDLALETVPARKAPQELARACMKADSAAAWALLSAHPRLLDRPTDELRHLPSAAAIAGKLECVRLMALLGFELRWEAGEGGTALHHAARYGMTGMVRLLLELGAPVNARDMATGSSPLAWAAAGSRTCRAGAEEEYCIVIRLLLLAGATREASINRWNETPESLASRRVRDLLKVLGFTPK
jgi:ankyrin repeat protein